MTVKKQETELDTRQKRIRELEEELRRLRAQLSNHDDDLKRSFNKGEEDVLKRCLVNH